MGSISLLAILLAGWSIDVIFLSTWTSVDPLTTKVIISKTVNIVLFLAWVIMGSVHTCIVETNINEEEALFYLPGSLYSTILEFLSCIIIWFLLLFSLICCFWEQSKVKNIYRSPLALKYLCWLTETHIWTFVTRRNCIKFERQKRHKWCSWVFPWCSYQFDISCDLVLYRPTTKCNLFLNTIKTQSVRNGNIITCLSPNRL